jgi:hypothetical protein
MTDSPAHFGGQLSGLLLLWFAATATLAAQAVPAAASSPHFTLPTIQGTLNYSVSLTQRESIGYNGENASNSSTSISGNLGFLSASETHPFSAVYSGGYLSGTAAGTSPFFQNLALSQSYQTKNYSFVAADSLSYLPNTPAIGLSGLPGLGDLGAAPLGGLPGSSGQDALSQLATHISNNASGTAERRLTGSTEVDLSGAYDTERFLGSVSAIQSNQYSGTGALSHRINARSSLAASYTYGQFSYIGESFSFVSQGVSAQYARQVTRKVHVLLAAGPQRIGASPLLGIPSSISYTANLALTYAGEFTSASLSYNRATTSGSGLTFGSRNDTASLTLSRRLLRSFDSSLAFRYGSTNSLQTQTLAPLDSQAYIASLQLNRTLTRTTSLYVSYSAIEQSYSGAAAGALNPLGGLSQTIALGLTYSPRSFHYGPH